MLMVCKTRIFIILIFLSAICNAAHGQSSRVWTSFGKDNSYFYFFDSINTKKIREKTYRVWVKSQATADSLPIIRKRLIQEYKISPQDAHGEIRGHDTIWNFNMNKDFDKCSFMISQFEIDCSEDKSRDINDIYYDSKDQPIESSKVTYPEAFEEQEKWVSIQQGSAFESLKNRICN